MIGANQFAPSFLMKMKAIASLEAMAKFISNEQLKGNNQTANLKLANLAYESLCTGVGRQIRKVAFSHENFTADGDSVVQAGVNEIKQAVSDIWGEVQADLSRCSTQVAARMFEFKSRKETILSRVKVIEELITSRENMAKPEESLRVMPDEEFITKLYDAHYDVRQFGLDLLPRLDRFINLHGNFFQKSAEKLTAALNEDYRTLDTKVLSDEIRRLIVGSEVIMPVNAENGNKFFAPSLPGSISGIFTLPEEGGETGLCQIANSITFQLADNGVRVKTMEPPINGIWSVVTSRKRIEDIKNTLEVLDKWYDDIYVKMWGDQAYSITLGKETTYRELSDPQTRELKLCVASIFGMMMQGCMWVDQYAFDVCEAMLRYIEISMNRYA